MWTFVFSKSQDQISKCGMYVSSLWNGSSQGGCAVRLVLTLMDVKIRTAAFNLFYYSSDTFSSLITSVLSVTSQCPLRFYQSGQQTHIENLQNIDKTQLRKTLGKSSLEVPNSSLGVECLGSWSVAKENRFSAVFSRIFFIRLRFISTRMVK